MSVSEAEKEVDYFNSELLFTSSDTLTSELKRAYSSSNMLNCFFRLPKHSFQLQAAFSIFRYTHFNSELLFPSCNTLILT